MLADLAIKYGLKKKEDLENFFSLRREKMARITFFPQGIFARLKDCRRFCLMWMR